MTDTAKQLMASGLYDEEDYDDPYEQEPVPKGHEEYGLGDNFSDDGRVDAEARLDEHEESKLFAELLFCVQGVGSIKNINGFDVYVKHDHCEESLRDILTNLKRDGATYPLVRLYLGQWSFLKKDLLPLLIFHKQDKRLSFITTMLLVQLTEPPSDTCMEKTRFYQYLREYKECFIESNMIQVLMEHLAECLQMTERSEKHENMIELIIVLFKQLLQIPDLRDRDQANSQSLQKRLLLTYSEESVLDSLIFMTQDFSQPFFQKISIQFLEIWYQIFKSFTPQQIITPEEGERQAQEEIEAEEKARQRRQNFLRGIRHSKFGSQLQKFREDGSSVLVGSIYQKNIELNQMGKVRRRPVGRMMKDQKRIIEAPNAHSLMNEGALEQNDKKLLVALKAHLLDLMQNSYCSLIEQVFTELAKNGENIYEFDKFHYFKLSSFMIQICRLQAYEKHKFDKQEVAKQIQAQQIQEEKKNLFNISKQKSKKIPMPKVPFNIDISLIGASLQLGNFEYLYATLIGEKEKNKRSEYKVKDFHAGLQLLTQFLYVIRDMGSSEDEKNKKNAQILLSNVFFHDLISISKTAFFIFEEKSHHKQFLHDAVEFNFLMTCMLDEYSKGKVLTIQTNKVKRVKKSKSKRKGRNIEVYGEVDQTELERMKIINEEEMDEDYNPNKPEGERDMEKEMDQLASNQEDFYDAMDDLSDDEDDYGETKYIERSFNFKAEIAKLLDYDIIGKYIIIIRDQDYKKNPLLIQAVNDWFKRIIQQLQTTWIFFQLEYLIEFEKILTEGQTNNPLMVGIDLNAPRTTRDRQIQQSVNELKQILITITRQFLDVLKKNHLLSIECLFKFSCKHIKDYVLTNYESMEYHNTIPASAQNNQLNYDDEEEVYDQKQKFQDRLDNNQSAIINTTQAWTEEQDNILIDNHEQFKDLGKKACFEFLAQLIDGKTPKQCYKRAKLLKLHKKGALRAKEISRVLNQQQNQNLSNAKITYAVKRFLISKIGNERQSIEQMEVKKYLEYIIEIEKGYLDFKQQEEDVLLFGKPEEVYDLQRGLPDYTVIPINKEQFDILKEQAFLELLATIDIKVVNSYPKISTFVNKDSFSSNIEVMFQSFNNLRNNDGAFDLLSLKNYEINIEVQPNQKDYQQNEKVRERSKKKHKKDKKKKKHNKKSHRRENKEDSHEECEKDDQYQQDEEDDYDDEDENENEEENEDEDDF